MSTLSGFWSAFLAFIVIPGKFDCLRVHSTVLGHCIEKVFHIEVKHNVTKKLMHVSEFVIGFLCVRYVNAPYCLNVLALFSPPLSDLPRLETKMSFRLKGWLWLSWSAHAGLN